MEKKIKFLYPDMAQLVAVLVLVGSRSCSS